MKKRLLSCVLAGAMIVAMLAGCGGNSAEENAVQQQSEAQEAGEIGFVPGSFLYQKNRLQLKL